MAGGRVLLVTLVPCAACSGSERRLGFYGMFVTDAFAVFMKALVLLGSAVTIIMALRFNEEHRHRPLRVSGADPAGHAPA